MNQELLDRLQKADPGLWEKIAETALSEYGYHDEDFNAWIFNAITYTNLFSPAQEAWLQHCLQEAIRWRGWHLYQIRNDDLPGLPCFADIIILGHGKEHDIHNEGEGSTESEALLRAYLAAIQEAE